jgi:FtsZ-interacting cell division protein ZipA
MIQPFFAQEIIPSEVIPGWRWMGLTIKELLILLGAVGAVTLVLVLWAAYWRKRPRSRRRHHHHHHHRSENQIDSPAVTEEMEPEDADEKRYRRKRRRRREHRPRNPTLAETGGLPPLRTERPPDPLP